MDSNGFAASPRVIKKDRVRVEAPGSPAAGQANGGLPAVRLREEGGMVRAIEVQCACGGRIVIDCDYAAGGATPAPKT